MNVRLDPRLFSAPNGGAQQVAGGDAAARAEIASLKKFIATKVGSDIATLSAALDALNKGVEGALATLVARVTQLEGVIAQMVTAAGGEVVTGDGVVVDAGPAVREAANAQPGDGNLPPEYFQGAGDDEAI